MPLDLTPIVKPINDLAAPVTNALSDAWSAVLGDKIAAWRLRNAAATQIKLHEELKRLGVSLDNAKIPERYAFAWFDEATKQDEPEIQELFARLLAKAAAGDEDAADRRHLEILSRMTPMDAQVMAWLFDKHALADHTHGIGEISITRAIMDELDDGAIRSVEHLILLGVIDRSYTIDGRRSRTPTRALATEGRLSSHAPNQPRIARYIVSTLLGNGLYQACAPVWGPS